MAVNCPRYPTAAYNDPGLLHSIHWYKDAPPTCKQQFNDQWDEKKQGASCTAMKDKMIAYAETNVRRLHCDSGDANAFFLSKTVFGTNNHVINGSDLMLDTCHVIENSYDPNVKADIDHENRIDYHRNKVQLGDRYGENDVASDYAVATVASPIRNVDTAPVDVMSFDEIEKSLASGKAVDLHDVGLRTFGTDSKLFRRHEVCRAWAE